MNSAFLLLFMLIPSAFSWQLIRRIIPVADLENCEELFIAKCRELIISDIKCVEHCKTYLNMAIEEIKANGKCTEKTGRDLDLCIRVIHMKEWYRKLNDRSHYLGGLGKLTKNPQ